MRSKLRTRLGLWAVLIVLSLGGYGCSERKFVGGDPAGGSDGGTEDSGTEDGATEDGATEDSATEDSATEDSATEDSATEDSATEDSATEDSATEDGGDPCSDVEDACEEASIICDGNVLVTCEENDDGCLVETRRDCDGFFTDLCDDTLESPACVEAVDPCAEIDSPCDEAGTGCVGTTIVTCEEDDNGCLVETVTECLDEGDNNTCRDGSDGPECTYDPCKDDEGADKDDVCAVDETVCSANVLVACTPDADGCPIATRTDCTMVEGANICNPNLAVPDCDFDPCLEVANPCLTEGATCDANTIVTCAADLDGCLVETVSPCAAGETCDDTEGAPVCTACTDDPACNAGEGVTCDGDLVQTCADSDGDGCLDVQTEDCGGTDFVCCDGDADPAACPGTVSEAGCVYAGTEVCLSDIEQVLGSMASYTGDTTGGGNEYGAYDCPGLFTPLTGAAEDRLFALDVPAATVVTVTLSQPEGAPDFTGAGAWLMLLDGCDAAATCEGITRSTVGYTNEATTAVRVYLSVDADPDVNAGDFGLEVDARPYACGDGRIDGSEQCDDGDLFAGDGCTADCVLEEGYACTDNEPSVCTRRPTDNVCGNVQCPALPDNAPGGSEVCCMPDERCGVTYDTYYGSGCFARNQMGTDDDACPAAESVFALFFPTLPGCCRDDGQCGLRSSTGAGCVERSELWLNMQDGLVGAFYSGPFDSISCGD